jgi:hypothetical protein
MMACCPMLPWSVHNTLVHLFLVSLSAQLGNRTPNAEAGSKLLCIQFKFPDPLTLCVSVYVCSVCVCMKVTGWAWMSVFTIQHSIKIQSGECNARVNLFLYLRTSIRKHIKACRQSLEEVYVRIKFQLSTIWRHVTNFKFQPLFPLYKASHCTKIAQIITDNIKKTQH